MPIRKGSHSEEKMYVHYGDSAFHRENLRKREMPNTELSRSMAYGDRL